MINVLHKLFAEKCLKKYNNRKIDSKKILKKICRKREREDEESKKRHSVIDLGNESDSEINQHSWRLPGLDPRSNVLILYVHKYTATLYITTLPLVWQRIKQDQRETHHGHPLYGSKNQGLRIASAGFTFGNDNRTIEKCTLYLLHITESYHHGLQVYLRWVQVLSCTVNCLGQS